jgi:hypothetical protein
MPFDPKTIIAMKEFYLGNFCKCGYHAQRWKKGVFYCHDCYPGNPEEPPVEVKIGRLTCDIKRGELHAS